MEPRNRFRGMNSASLGSLAGRYDHPIPTRFLAPIDCLKIPALDWEEGNTSAPPPPHNITHIWDWILRRNSDKSLKSFPSWYSQSPLPTALPWDLYFFKRTQPLTCFFKVMQPLTCFFKVMQPLTYFFKLLQPLMYFYSSVTVHCQGERRNDRKPYPLPYPYRNLKSENSQDYTQNPQRNCTFMNSASGSS